MRRTDTCELRELPCEGYQIISLNTYGISQRKSNDAEVLSDKMGTHRLVPGFDSLEVASDAVHQAQLRISRMGLMHRPPRRRARSRESHRALARLDVKQPRVEHEDADCLGVASPAHSWVIDAVDITCRRS